MNIFFYFEFLFSNNVSKYFSFQKFSSQILFPKLFKMKFLCFFGLVLSVFGPKIYLLFILNLIFFLLFFLSPFLLSNEVFFSKKFPR